MMNGTQHHLTKLCEESLEVMEELQIHMNRLAKRALKAQQFGLDESEPDQPFTNLQRLHNELDDIQGVLRVLNDQFNFQYTPSEERIQKKIAKMQKYTGYSKSLGLVSGE